MITPPQNSRQPTINWYPSPITDFMQQAMVKISDDVELCIEVGGNPQHPPLLLIMGLGSQLVFWPDNFIKKLIDEGFYVVRYDNRDIGLSSKIDNKNIQRKNTKLAMLRLQLGLDNSQHPTAYDLIDLADDAAKLVTTLNLSKVNVLGASMGGMIAQIMAANYPQLIDKLSLLFSSNNRPFLPPPRPKQLNTLIKKPATYEEEAVVEHSKWFIRTVGSPGHINERKVACLAKLRYERSFYPQGTINQFNAILATGSIQRYSKKIQAHTLIMHGSEDGLIPPSHGKALAKDIPNAEFKLIKGMGHDLADYFHPFIIRQLKQHILK